MVNPNLSNFVSDPHFDFNFKQLAHILHVSHRLFPHVDIDITLAHHILVTAAESVHGQYSIEDAVVWADVFVFPPEVYTNDYEELLSLGGDLPELIRRKQSRNKYPRLSEERLTALWELSDPDIDLLYEFARDGVHVMTGHRFVPRREMPKSFSPTYSIAYPAVNKLIYDSYKANLAVILPSDCITRLPPEVPVHQSRLAHTLKKGKPQGRVTSNYSYGEPESRLNTDEVREMARERYGDIQLSTVIDMALMVLKQYDRAKELGRDPKDLILCATNMNSITTVDSRTPWSS